LPGVKWPGREADHIPPSSAEAKDGGAIPPLSHMSSWRGAPLPYGIRTMCTVVLLLHQVQRRVRRFCSSHLNQRALFVPLRYIYTYHTIMRLIYTMLTNSSDNFEH
jgi:hypothetical protein